MASGPLVGGSSGGGAGGGAGGGGREVPRERQRWADKVYTRKIYRGKREPSSQPPQPQPQPPEQQQQQPESAPEKQRDEPPHQQLHREQHPEPQRQQLEKAHSPRQEQPSQETLALLRLQPSQETLATTATATATTTTTAAVALDNGGGASPPSPHRPSPARHDDEGRPQEPPAHGSESTASDNAPVGLNSISNYNHTTDKTRTFGPPQSGAHPSAADQTNGRPRPRPPFVSYKRDSSGKRRLVVNLASRSRQEVKELHGKLTTELGQVRAMLLQVEECEKRLLAAVATPPPPTTHALVPVEVGYATLPEFSGNGGAPTISAPPLALPAGVGYTHAAQQPVFPPGNGTFTTPIAKKFTNSEGGGYTAIRPMQRQLSVSVGTGLLDTTSVSNSMGDVMEKEKRTPKANQYYTNSEFLLAKDKFPPSDSHSKKSKSKTDHGARGGSKPYERAFKSCVSLLSRLMKHRHGWVFNKPVDVKGLGLHDYYTIIKCPMDLGTIKSRLNSNFYRDPRDFAEDVRLTFRNAMLYNPKGQDVHVMAEQLLQIFEDRWPMIEAEMTMPVFPTILTKKLPPPPLDMRRILERSASSFVRPMWSEQATTPYSFTPQSVRSAAPKKPKAKDPNKRDMTFDEKQKLSKNLQSLPLERVEMVVQIIKRRNSALSQHDGEIEVDIDSVDTETLWELDRFVTNYKKSLSKHKRKAEMALQAKLEAERIAQLRNPAPLAIAELQKDNDTGGKHGLSASPVREENREEKDKDDNESASSSSCSSSSDSGSSSSDSDSDSSSS